MTKRVLLGMLTPSSNTALEPITSHGPSGIGFVNFGDIGTLTVRAPIQTYGKGARGFNLYDGSLQKRSSSPSRRTVMARSACSRHGPSFAVTS